MATHSKRVKTQEIILGKSFASFVFAAPEDRCGQPQSEQQRAAATSPRVAAEASHDDDDVFPSVYTEA